MYIGIWDVDFVCNNTKSILQKIEIKLKTPKPQTDVGYLSIAAQAAMSSNFVKNELRGSGLPGSIKSGIYIKPVLKSCSDDKQTNL